jgi:M61 glycyl aminopeptidase
MNRFIKIIFFLIFLTNISSNIYAGKTKNAKIIWEDDFTDSEKKKLSSWLKTSLSASEKLLGKYQFEHVFFIQKSENASEPVPWAHTTRSSPQAVHFHVNPDFALQEFVGDWTAVHEISHLAIPFLGSENSWFAEGFATYMQNLILLDMGIYDEAKYREKYKYKLEKARPHFTADKSFISVLKSLRSNHQYPEMYYGACCFFLELNKKYQNQTGNDLLFYLHKYQKCCRNGHSSLNDFISELDRISNSTIASNFLEEMGNAQLVF